VTQLGEPAEWVRDLDEPSVAPLLATLRRTLDSFVEIGWVTSRSTGCRAVRHSASR
jgi:hypothetical protein